MTDRSNLVRTAILDRFRDTYPTELLRDDRPDYVRDPAHNLLPDLVDEAVLDDLSSADGGELTGALPKFCAVHSSSCLAANAFGPYRFHPERLQLVGLSGFTSARFEKKLPTGLSGTPPNLDFFATGPEGTVAVESKFTEILSPKPAKFAPSYEGAIDRLAEGGWGKLYRSLIEDPGRFSYVDAAQLVKHYLGVRNSLNEDSAPTVLAYVYWEPRDWELIPEFVRHRAEVEEFADAVSDSEVRFVSITYPELWEEWATAERWQGSSDHVEALRERYLVSVTPEG